MRLFCAVTCLLVSLAFAHHGAAAPDHPVKGTWEGESKCTVPDSPCHDEHVIYEIADDTKVAGLLNVDAYKIVKGEKQFMGALACTWSTPRLRCSGNPHRQDEWLFVVAGDRMTGTLTLDGGKLLYRRVSVTRSR